MLKSVEEVVEAVGGDEVAAELAGVGIAAVLNWKGRDNKIPPRHVLLFSQAVGRKGKQIDPSVFGLKSIEEARA